ncbi:hypothetical protein GDO81_029628 [Engystomops pustulosus]|uniref:protein-tyrosine-phosphatase n=1 Tax=Engystomops pustulosus TaxID=76066 RepID=A0AAV6ZTH7_ENGPU|nr:hypothetical protein GDO81_029628 [Engystomops pustulosus]
MTLSWMEPVNMTGVDKSYIIRYGNSSGTWTVASNTTSVTLQDLTSGTNYTITVVTVGVRGYQSSAVSTSVYTTPASVVASLNNYKSVDVLGVTWMKPEGRVDYYTVSLIGSINPLIYTTTTTQVNITGLLPGREYTVLVQPHSGTCVQTTLVTGATYPTDVGPISFKNIGTNDITLSWMEPVDMTGVDKSYNIRYGNSSDTWTVTTTTTSISLQNLTSGTNYTITVVTVGVRGYQSSAVTTSVYTRKPDQSSSIQITRSISDGSMDITFSPFDTSEKPIVAYAVIITTEMNDNRPPWGILSKTYNDFKNASTKTYVTHIIEQQARSGGSSDLWIHVGDRNMTHSYVNGPLEPQLQYRYPTK